jgi:hypothetical protein
VHWMINDAGFHLSTAFYSISLEHVPVSNIKQNS